MSNSNIGHMSFPGKQLKTTGGSAGIGAFFAGTCRMAGLHRRVLLTSKCKESSRIKNAFFYLRIVIPFGGLAEAGGVLQRFRRLSPF